MPILQIEVEDARPVAARCDDALLQVTLADGRALSAPLWWYPRLANATPEERQEIELTPLGIHCPRIDEDISVASMFRGEPAPGARALYAREESMIKDTEIKEVAERVLRQDSTRPGFLGADVASDVDFGGAPVIRITARYRSMPQPARPLDGMHTIRTELLKMGESRVVFLTNKYEDEPITVEDDEA